MSRILPLPPEAISKIHSSKHITGLQGVVLSLLENSLDAGSTKVDITVDFRRGGCTVEDDGLGIPPGEFLEDGGLTKMYHTSKRGPSIRHEHHGSAGTYLASLAVLSLLSITSLQDKHNKRATLTIHQGEVIGRKVLASPTENFSLSILHGTSVTVRDLFGNMPVRVKQRALAADAGSADLKAWLELKRGVVALLLAWRGPCSVRLRNINVDSKVLHLSGQHPSLNADLTEKSLKQLAGKATTFELKDAVPVLFQAGLAPPESRSKWVPVSASTSKLSVKGVICLDPAPTKQCRFISIGIHPCAATAQQHDVYEVVDTVFTNSSFGSVDEDSDIDEGEKDRRKRDRRYKRDGYTQKQLQGRKGVDRWPMFVMQVKFRDQRSQQLGAEDITDASLKTIVEVLEATVTQWLTSNHFRPRKRKRKRRKNEDQHSPAIASSSQRSSSVGPPPRSGSALPDVATPTLKRAATVGSATSSKRRKVLDFSGRARVLNENRSAAAQSPSTYFNTWSRIKSGRHGFYDKIWRGRKPATAPAGQSGSITSPAQRKQRPVFNLPALEAGELSSAKPTTVHKTRASLLPVPTASTINLVTNDEPQASSEDFGSVDDAEMLALTESAEPTHTDVRNGDMIVTGNEDEQGLEIPQDLAVDWTDLATRQIYKVNSRTGVVLPSRPKLSDITPIEARNAAGINISVSSKGKPLSLARRTSPLEQKEQRWLPGFLKDWDNPVFALQDEEQIPVASLDGPGMDAEVSAGNRCTHEARTAAFAEVGAKGTSKLSKVSLKQARVIRQVDQKFILCKIKMAERGDGREILILVDQHAASERVILEGLLSVLCTPVQPDAARYKSRVRTVPMEKPLRFNISGKEDQLFQDQIQHFAEWGVLYHLMERKDLMAASQARASKLEFTIVVDALPPSIIERCTLVPKLLIELLRSEVWNVADSVRRLKPQPDDQGPETIVDDDKDKLWLKRIGSCPKGILERLNSRACRSAIMFNDELSIAQCEELLADLSECTFPFMCAHGRVSMVPLVEFGEGDASSLARKNESMETFTGAFRRWNYGGRLGSNYLSSH